MLAVLLLQPAFWAVGVVEGAGPALVSAEPQQELVRRFSAEKEELAY